jgi:hypothetical protein
MMLSQPCCHTFVRPVQRQHTEKAPHSCHGLMWYGCGVRAQACALQWALLAVLTGSIFLLVWHACMLQLQVTHQGQPPVQLQGPEPVHHHPTASFGHSSSSDVSLGLHLAQHTALKICSLYQDPEAHWVSGCEASRSYLMCPLVVFDASILVYPCGRLQWVLDVF